MLEAFRLVLVHQYLLTEKLNRWCYLFLQFDWHTTREDFCLKEYSENKLPLTLVFLSFHKYLERHLSLISIIGFCFRNIVDTKIESLYTAFVFKPFHF